MIINILSGRQCNKKIRDSVVDRPGMNLESTVHHPGALDKSFSISVLRFPHLLRTGINAQHKRLPWGSVKCVEAAPNVAAAYNKHSIYTW